MSDEDTSLEGGCTCGQVRYKMRSTPLFVHACHCTWCQRQSGGSYAVNALIEADRVELIKGEVAHILVKTPSGTGQSIARCPKCQVAVWSNYLVFGGQLGEHVRFIRVGTLDNSAAMPPDVHIYTKSKHPWVTLPPNTPAVDVYYDRDKLWSAASLTRLDALERSLANPSNP